MNDEYRSDLIMSNPAYNPSTQKIDMYIVFVGDEDHPPRERIRYRYWGCVQRWLFEHCYVDEPLATAEKARVGKFHAVVRERFTSAGRERVVISQSKHWQYDLDRRAGLWSIIWVNVAPPYEGEVRDTGWTYACQNCGFTAYEQQSFSEGKWHDAGVQCRTCWRTYYSENDYSY